MSQNFIGGEDAPAGGLGSRLTRRRQLYGLGVAAVGAPLLTLLLVPVRDSLGLDTVLLLFVLVSVAASAVGGVLPALAASVVSFGLANFFFAPPYGSLLVENSNELLDLIIFFAVALGVGVVTEFGARGRARAERSLFEAEWLAELGTREHGPDSVEMALADAREIFGMHAATLTEGDRVLIASGAPEADDILFVTDAGENLQLQLSGPERVGEDRSLLSSLALTAGRLWRTQQLAGQARRAEELGKIDELRASLLAAVGHDLRNPLAAINAAATTLRQTDIELDAADKDELLETIETHAGRLNDIIGNLLDMSRLQAGALSVHPVPTVLLEVLAGVVRLGEGRVELDIPEDLPMISADAGLLERVLANLVANADRHLPPGEKVTIAARRDGATVAVRVIDHGPGVAPERMGEIFAPFQHFGDRSTTGLGLGLAIARGFAEAMGGTLSPSRTPGGGLTMTVTLEVADATAADR
ncbi:MAG: sensor histidine kinase [Propionicimonas sp.]